MVVTNVDVWNYLFKIYVLYVMFVMNTMYAIRTMSCVQEYNYIYMYINKEIGVL